MSLSDLASIGSFVSGIGVLASLVYLALQVRRAEKYQKALMQVERATQVGNHMRFLADPAIIEPFIKGSLGVPEIHGQRISTEHLYLFGGARFHRGLVPSAPTQAA